MKKRRRLTKEQQLKKLISEQRRECFAEESILAAMKHCGISESRRRKLLDKGY